MDYKEIVGLVISVIPLGTYIPYFKSIFANKVKPHIFSWVIWSMTSGIAAAAQLAEGAGPGAWLSVSLCLACFAVAVVSIKKGEKNITTSDWLFFVLAAAAIPVWIITDEPLLATIIVTVIDTLALAPTIRKSWNKPTEESAQLYLFGGIYYAISLIAIRDYNLTTLLYPAGWTINNLLFVAFLFYRRVALDNTAIQSDSKARV